MIIKLLQQVFVERVLSAEPCREYKVERPAASLERGQLKKTCLCGVLGGSSPSMRTTARE